MSYLHTEIVIDAPASVVWEELTDFGSYPEWNDYMHVHGEAAEGARLRVEPGTESGGGPTFEPRVVTIDEGRELTWLGHLYVKGLFDGEHSFTVRDLGNGQSRLEQSEDFSGLLSGLIMRRYGERTEANFHGFNEALKARAEAIAETRAG